MRVRRFTTLCQVYNGQRLTHDAPSEDIIPYITSEQINQDYKLCQERGIIKPGSYLLSCGACFNAGGTFCITTQRSDMYFRLPFRNTEDKNSIARLRYGSQIAARGFIPEIAVRYGYSFIFGQSEPVAEIPRVMHVTTGFSLTILNLNVTCFKLREFPRTMIVSTNNYLGMGLLGFGRISEGTLALDYNADATTEKLRRKWVDYFFCTAFGVGTALLYGVWFNFYRTVDFTISWMKWLYCWKDNHPEDPVEIDSIPFKTQKIND